MLNRAILESVHNSRRRDFLKAAASFCVLPLIGQQTHGALKRTIFQNDPFQLGIASGDPSADGFVLWTRLAPDPLNGGGMSAEDVAVGWEIGTDEGMSNIVRSGRTVASSSLAHSVHVELEGLQPDRWYFYRFHAGDAVSPVGRTRTAPLPQARIDRLRFSFVSCQHFETGYYNAYRHMLDDDLDLIIHLGDYIYESGVTKRDDPVRRHNSAEIQSLDDYRNRHALYRGDPDLQAAHARHPWLVTWDDHEFDNNYASDISEQSHVDTESFLKRRACAYQAYYEHMPLRRSSIPQGPHLQLYRSVPWGLLAEFDVLDTRQYRTDQPCGDKRTQPCDGIYADSATLLGNKQEQWLKQQLQNSHATWNVLAQQVMMARVDRDPTSGIVYSPDQWSGYDVGRRRLLQFFADAKIVNPVVLTGDIHNNWVNDLKVDFDDDAGDIVATEFVGTSVSSGGNGSPTRSDTPGVLRDNPFVRFFNNERGYVRCQVTPDGWTSDYRTISTVLERESKCVTRSSWTDEPGTAGAQPV